MSKDWRTKAGPDGKAKLSASGKPIRYQQGDGDKGRLPIKLRQPKTGRSARGGKVIHENLTTRLARGLLYYGMMGEGYDFNRQVLQARHNYGDQVVNSVLRKYREMKSRSPTQSFQERLKFDKPDLRQKGEFMGERISFLDDDGKVLHGMVSSVETHNKDGTVKEYLVIADDNYEWVVAPDEVKGVFEKKQIHMVKESKYNYNKPKKIEAMLATKGKEEFLDTGDYWAEPKWDGTRGFGIKTPNRITIRGRSWITDFAPRYPEISSDLEEVAATNVVFDGELVFVDKKTGEPVWLTGLAKKSTAKKRGVRMVYMIYDIIHLDDKDLSSLPYRERRRILAEVVPDDLRNVRISPIYKKRQKKRWREVVKKKREGLMMKKPDSPYRFKRHGDWRKLKLMYTEGAEMYDAVVIGYTAGKGKFKGQLGALILAQRSGNQWLYIGRSSGMDDDMRKSLTKKLKARKVTEGKMPKIFDLEGYELEFPEAQVLVKPKMVVEVKAGKRNDTGTLSWASFERLRPDKPPKEAIAELSQIGITKAEARLLEKVRK